MAEHKNFYENLAEARMRLNRTTVCYEGRAYYVLEIVDNPDGKFRIYLDPIGPGYGWGRDKWPSFPSLGGNSTSAHPAVAGLLDQWIADNPSSGVIRRYMSSRGFNKYRPFPLGNMNKDGKVFYIERTPTRSTIQGLRNSSVNAYLVSASPSRSNQKLPGAFSSSDSMQVSVELLSPEFADTVAGTYPSYQEVINKLCHPDVINEGCAFHREFSVLRGPVDTLFLCYKTDGIGIIDDSSLTIGRQFKHLVESVQELNIFNQIKLR